MTGLALARFTCYVKQIFTSFVTNSELLCSLRFQGWVKARNVISFLYSWIAGRRSKLGSSLNHTSPHPHTAIVGNISLFRKICVSLRSYATLWSWVGNFVFIFTLHYWDYGKKDRRCVWLLWCECLIRWRCSHILFYKLADQKLTWTLQLHCKIPEWMETSSAQYCDGKTVKANLWHCFPVKYTMGQGLVEYYFLRNFICRKTLQ